MDKSKKNIRPLAYHYYFFPVVILTLVGFADAIYLSLSHYRNYVDLGYQSFCAISQAFNCDTVAQSPYSILFNVPLAIWGIMGYGTILILLGFAWPTLNDKKRVWTLLMLVAAMFSVFSIYLAYLSAYKIHSYCIMCILSYAVSFSLLFYTWFIRKRFVPESFKEALKKDLLFLLSFRKLSTTLPLLLSGGALVLVFAFPPYWQMSAPELTQKIPSGVSENGHPWIGAERPKLTIVEFSDYRCFKCKKMHLYLRKLVNAYPETLRLVHRHFPLDHTINPIVKEPFYIGSAKLAIVSIFAASKGKFWEMNDALFNIADETEAINIRDLASEVGISYEEIKYVFQNKKLWNQLKRDIRAGLQYKLTGTPGFIINGRVYIGQIPAEILREYGLN